MSSHSNQPRRGAAIILVLVCLLALSSLVLGNQEIAFKGAFAARLLAEEYKADLMAESALEAAMFLLEEDEESESDTKFERWAREWGRESVTIHIIPSNSRLNVNSVGTSERMKAALVKLIEKGNDEKRLMSSLLDWIDKDDKEAYPGSEGARYLKIWPPYTPRNNDLRTLGELSLVADWRGVVGKYRDFLTIYGNSKLNLNFVSKEVFVAAFPELDDSWRQVEAWRETRGYTSVADLRESIPSLANDDDLYTDVIKSVTVESKAFEVVVEVDLPLVYEKRRYHVLRTSDQFQTKKPQLLAGHLVEVRYKDSL